VRRLYTKKGIRGFYTGYWSLATVEYPLNMLEVCTDKSWQPAAVWCSVLQCFAVCCSVLQCVAVCYSVVLKLGDG